MPTFQTSTLASPVPAATHSASHDSGRQAAAKKEVPHAFAATGCASPAFQTESAPKPPTTSSGSLGCQARAAGVAFSNGVTRPTSVPLAW